MQATERFTELVRRPDAEIPLDEAALLIAAHDHPVDVDAERAGLDDLAANLGPEAVPIAAADVVAALLFRELGFAGNTDRLRRPAQLVSRRGAGPAPRHPDHAERAHDGGRAARRVVHVDGVGMPGHFLVGAGDPGVFYDPFNGGARLDADGCREQFTATHGDAPFRPEYLAPVTKAAIVSRMLANLVHTFVQRDPSSAVWAMRLRLRVPGLPRPRTHARPRVCSARSASSPRRRRRSTRSRPKSDGELARRAERDAALLRSRAN